MVRDSGRGAARLLAATAAVLLLLGLGRTAAPADGAISLTVTAVGHDAAVVGVVAGARVSATHQLDLASTPPAHRPAAAPGARTPTDGTSRTPAPHLVASTGDRAPPALP